MTGSHLLYPIDDDQLAFLEAVGHHDVTALLDARRYAALLDLLRAIDHEDVAAGLIEQDSGLRYRQRQSRRTPLQCDTHDPAGDQEAIGVRHLRAHRHGIRRCVDLHVEEIADAGMGIDVSVRQPDMNDDVGVLVRFSHPALVVENVALADLKDDVDRILADDGGKPSGRGLHQIADGERGEPDPPVDRRADLGVAEIDLRLVELRLRLHDARQRPLFVRLALVDGGLRDVVVADELLAALQLQLCVDLRRLGLGERGARLLDGSLVRRLLDPEQQIALLDLLPFGEIALLDEARHARDDIDFVDRRDPSDVVAGLRDLAADHGRDGNGRRRHGVLRSSRAAAGNEDCRSDGGQPADEHIETEHRPSSRG